MGGVTCMKNFNQHVPLYVAVLFITTIFGSLIATDSDLSRRLDIAAAPSPAGSPSLRRVLTGAANRTSTPDMIETNTVMRSIDASTPSTSTPHLAIDRSTDPSFNFVLARMILCNDMITCIEKTLTCLKACRDYTEDMGRDFDRARQLIGINMKILEENKDNTIILTLLLNAIHSAFKAPFWIMPDDLDATITTRIKAQCEAIAVRYMHALSDLDLDTTIDTDAVHEFDPETDT